MQYELQRPECFGKIGPEIGGRRADPRLEPNAEALCQYGSLGRSANCVDFNNTR
jgi:hypothetical protein